MIPPEWLAGYTNPADRINRIFKWVQGMVVSEVLGRRLQGLELPLPNTFR
jgi:hypothetical protein